MAAFAAEAPGVKLRLEVKASEGVIEDLIGRKVDLAFVGIRVPHPELHFEEFAEDEVILVAGPGLSGLPSEAVAPSLVAQLPRVEWPHGRGSRAVVEDRFTNMGVPLNPEAMVMETTNLISMKAAVMSGMGVAFISKLAVSSELIAGSLREVKIQNVKIPRRIFVAWRQGETVGPAARCFLEVARRLMKPMTEDS